MQVFFNFLITILLELLIVRQINGVTLNLIILGILV